MCGRFIRIAREADLEREYGLVRCAPVAAAFNIAPSQPILTVRSDADGQRQGVPLAWGLVPAWVKPAQRWQRPINARVETLVSNGAFRAAARQRRCLVPANGWYEWSSGGEPAGKSPRQPWLLAPSSPSLHRIPAGEDLPALPLFAMAGVWEPRGPQATGDQLAGSVAIVTTAAQPSIRHLHARQPLLLPRDLLTDWLDPALRRPDQVRLLVDEVVARSRAHFVDYQAWPVSRRVNNPRQDDASLIKPLARSEPGTAGGSG